MSKTLTFEECNRIAVEYARRPVPATRTTALTAKGSAVVLARWLGRAIAELDEPRDRIDVMSALTAEAVRCLKLDAPWTA